jgi:hypothetical protein
VYVEEVRVPESLAIGRQPLIQCNVLTLFVNFFEVSKQPASRLWSRESSEGRPQGADLVSDECEEKGEERTRKKGGRKEPGHVAWGWTGVEEVYIGSRKPLRRGSPFMTVTRQAGGALNSSATDREYLQLAMAAGTLRPFAFMRFALSRPTESVHAVYSLSQGFWRDSQE